MLVLEGEEDLAGIPDGILKEEERQAVEGADTNDE